MYKADLHVHSTILDSNYTVDDIIDKAKDLGLTHIAFTEYDTTKGSEYAVKCGIDKGIKVVPGIEISSYDRFTGKKVHILGYNYKDTNNIRRLCDPMIVRRNNNCIRQIKIIQKLGYDINVNIIKEMAGEFIYTQHILHYLYKTGQIDSIFGDMYNKVFKNGGPCDFDIEYVSPIDAIRAIRADGGHAVLAHPGQQENFNIVFNLIEAGLNGIEINHHGNNETHKKGIESICRANNLFMTGGSDFHGEYQVIGSEIGSHLAHESSEVIFS